MPSHVIVGASRGLGYQFLKVFSQDPSNQVIGLVRNAGPTQEKVKNDGLQNVTILSADLTSYESLLKAADEVRKITGGSLDYLWNNGAYMGTQTIDKFFSDFEPQEYDILLNDLQLNFSTNVIGVINAINAFLPLIKKSSIKKVITLSTGLSDISLSRDYGLWEHAPYSIAKTALNHVVAKYDARFRSEGILFLAISPGVVNTGGSFNEDSQMPGKFFKYSQDLKVIEVDESVEAVTKLVYESTASEDGGQIYSHLGKGKKWL